MCEQTYMILFSKLSFHKTFDIPIFHFWRSYDYSRKFWFNSEESRKFRFSQILCPWEKKKVRMTAFLEDT